MSTLKIILEPKVSLLSTQTFTLPEHFSGWETDAPSDGERLAEFAGRLCYMSLGPDLDMDGHKTIKGRVGNDKYLDNILQVKHGSVAEHAVWSFLFEGVSRSLTHELVRHRAGMSYCLAGDTLINSGTQEDGKWSGTTSWRIDTLYRWAQDPKRSSRVKRMHVRSFDGETFVQNRIVAVAKSGVKELFKVTLAGGNTIRCSIDHRFLSERGWRSLGELAVGDMLGVNGIPMFKDWMTLRDPTKTERPPSLTGYGVLWRAIVSIEPAGKGMTYDLEVEAPHHNFVANGIVTHNSQLSQRYVDESEVAFVLPPELREEYDMVKEANDLEWLGEGDDAIDYWAFSCGVVLADYNRILAALTEKLGYSQETATMQKKRARQTARSVLPNCTETKIVVTGNGRSWRHFLEMRGSTGADMEIRRLAVVVARMLKEQAPNMFGDIDIVPHTDGTELVSVKYSKV
jgi:flavin-dependent thymidylate synthase